MLLVFLGICESYAQKGGRGEGEIEGVPRKGDRYKFAISILSGAFFYL